MIRSSACGLPACTRISRPIPPRPPRRHESAREASLAWDAFHYCLYLGARRFPLYVPPMEHPSLRTVSDRNYWPFVRFANTPLGPIKV